MASRVLLATQELTLGEFACAPGERLWDEVNTNIGPRPHVVFPRTHVLIAQEGARPVLATPNLVVFYKPHQRYRRGLRDARGDRSPLARGRARAARARPAAAGPAAPSDARAFLLAVASPATCAPSRRPTGCWPRRARCGCSTRRCPPARARGGGAARPHARRARRARRGGAGAARGPHGRAAVARGARAPRSPSPPSTSRACSARRPASRSRATSTACACAGPSSCSRPSPRSTSRGSRSTSATARPATSRDRFRAAFGRPPSALRGAQLRTIVEAARAGRA